LGAALVEIFARSGANVIIIDIDKAQAEQLIISLATEGVKHTPSFYEANVADLRHIESLLVDIAKSKGSLDVMINNAAILVAGDARDMDIDLFRKTVDINLMGVAGGSLAAYKIMAKQGYGKIVNVSSMCGILSSPLYTAYSASKHGVVGLSKALREEGRSLGVDVMVACPGNIKTSIFDSGSVINAPKVEVFKDSALSAITADAAAKKIIMGMVKNNGIIVFPWYSKILFFLERIHPLLIYPLHKVVLRNFRKCRLSK
jgi:short-subunit dehydrogenase